MSHPQSRPKNSILQSFFLSAISSENQSTVKAIGNPTLQTINGELPPPNEAQSPTRTREYDAAAAAGPKVLLSLFLEKPSCGRARHHESFGFSGVPKNSRIEASKVTPAIGGRVLDIFRCVSLHRGIMALDLESMDSRSTSPQEHTGRPGAPSSHHPLKFSIEKILSPDFGRRDNNAKDIPHNENTAPGVSSDLTKGSSFPPVKETGKIVFPAWLFCTRYSDRPSSGK
ncbi:unnamed protein product [Larinioides sclopetarius]|uniref:Uncharacterized protein n=1 Tax=Larinioides sclopetarius TaxID=280406 RepID=A0AAV2BCS5_9ARAC